MSRDNNHARIQWVKIVPIKDNTQVQDWWPALIYKNIDEALELSTSDTRILSHMFVEHWQSPLKNQNRSIAFLLGELESEMTKFIYIDDCNDENYVLPFYVNFGHLYDRSNVLLKSAVDEAVARLRSNQTPAVSSQAASAPRKQEKSVKDLSEFDIDDKCITRSTEKPKIQRLRRRQCDILLEENSQNSIDCSATTPNKKSIREFARTSGAVKDQIARQNKRKRTL